MERIDISFLPTVGGWIAAIGLPGVGLRKRLRFVSA